MSVGLDPETYEEEWEWLHSQEAAEPFATSELDRQTWFLREWGLSVGEAQQLARVRLKLTPAEALL